MVTPYLITFTPVNRFFFGGSRSFAESFYAKSMKFPQPATILGCLRSTILRQNGIDPRKCGGIPDLSDEKVIELTGASQVRGFNDSGDFGVIERLSPVFIVRYNNDGDIGDLLFPIPADLENAGSFYRYITYKKENNSLSCYSGRRREFAVNSDKNPKLFSPYSFGGKDFWGVYLKNQQIPCSFIFDESNIFTTHTSVGIGCKSKNIAGGKVYFKKTIEEHKFYTKIDYSFHKGFSFGVILWLTKEDVIENGIVLMGGERSVFYMEVHRFMGDVFSFHPLMKVILRDEYDLSRSMETCTNKDKIVALSPLIMDRDDNEKLIDNIEHRVVKGVQTMRMLNSGAGVKVDKSESFCMIPAGSVLYPSGSEQINQWKMPCKIGYNHVMKIQRG